MRSLEDSASLFQHDREEGDAFGNAVNFDTRTGDLATDRIEDERQPEACSRDAENRSDDACDGSVNCQYMSAAEGGNHTDFCHFDCGMRDGWEKDKAAVDGGS